MSFRGPSAPLKHKEYTPPETAAEDEETPGKPPHLRLQLVQTGIIFDLDSREQIVIGRKGPDQEPDVDLAPYGGVEQGVSRRHAMITLKQGQYYIEDLKSINDTLLNSSRLYPSQRYRLRDGDRLQFGAMVVKVLL
jgi:pSer/pThr/pTyr-binding forkhead associated (FHA) protein